MRKKGSLLELQQLRLVAANMFDCRLPPAAIAPLLGVDDQTVRRWRRVYDKAGRDGLAMRKPGGRPVKLSAEQKRELVGLLKAEPKAHGFDAYLWTTKLIARLILERFGVSHHHDHVGVILHESGWSPQVPARRAKERDEAKIAASRDEVWPAIEKKVGPRAGRSSSPTRSAS